MRFSVIFPLVFHDPDLDFPPMAFAVGLLRRPVERNPVYLKSRSRLRPSLRSLPVPLFFRHVLWQLARSTPFCLCSHCLCSLLLLSESARLIRKSNQMGRAPTAEIKSKILSAGCVFSIAVTDHCLFTGLRTRTCCHQDHHVSPRVCLQCRSALNRHR